MTRDAADRGILDQFLAGDGVSEALHGEQGGEGRGRAKSC
eukprot:CAMPEP_0185251076 /NCGR_PEP_ID=MMETSP1359-20130426/383_1 /TAXON_ID=552665 /ORGANISM="Bigelowiella longifila, Strain CCMP242" /LENGTH=39 /DNA_ID= /DNA_START= /DNA_END= /DNA_ORIENTATION=